MKKYPAPLLIVSFILMASLFSLYVYQKRTIKILKSRYDETMDEIARIRSQHTIPSRPDISQPGFSRKKMEVPVDEFSMLTNDFIRPCKGPLNIQKNAFKKGDDYSQHGQSTKIAKLLNYKRNGVFFEVGAADGVRLSNSLYFEKSLNWTGLLVEMDHGHFDQLEKVCRNAYALRGCLTQHEKPKDVQFVREGLGSHLQTLVLNKNRKPGSGKSTCYPGTLVFKAAGIRKVDYAVVDVEGAELEILDALPFGDVYFDILQIEYSSLWQIKEGWSAQNSKKKYMDYMSEKLPHFKKFDEAVLDLFYRNTEKYED